MTGLGFVPRMSLDATAGATDTARMESRSAERRPEIDGLRALAVLSVLMCHSVYFAGPAVTTAIGRAGSRGVELFFVLSGFCLAYPGLRALRESGRPLPGALAFLRRRFARIAPPYYVAILMFSVLAFTKFGLPTWPPNAPTLSDIVADALTAMAFAPNPQLNCDFWTLGVEMRWYFVFPVLLAIYVRSKTAFVVLGLAFYAIYAFYASALGVVDFGVLPCFMSGIVAADLAVRRYAWRAHVWPLALAAVALCVWLQSQTTELDHGNPLWHLASFLTVVAVTGNARAGKIFAHPALVATGVASYSIYLVHHPIVNEFALRGCPWQLAAAIALGCGFAFWRFVEAPMLQPAIRRRIEHALESFPRTFAVRKPRVAE